MAIFEIQCNFKDLAYPCTNALQMAQEGDGEDVGILLEDRQQQRLPDDGERIGDGAAAPGLARGRQAGGGLDTPGGALAETCTGGGGTLGVTKAVLHVGSHLLVGGGFARHVAVSVWSQRSRS